MNRRIVVNAEKYAEVAELILITVQVEIVEDAEKVEYAERIT